MRITLLLLVLIAGSAFAGQTVWKWVDDKGVTHYSDRAVPGATRMEMSGGKSSSTPSPDSSGDSGSDSAAEPEVAYSEFTIWQPSDGENFVNTGGAVTVSIRLQPILKPGHSIFLYLDGQLVQGYPESTLSYDLQNVPRGTHSVIAVINDSSSKRIQESGSVTFYVRQESIGQPPVGPSMRTPPKPRPNASAKPLKSQPTYAALNPARSPVDPVTNKPVPPAKPKAKPQPVTPKAP